MSTNGSTSSTLTNILEKTKLININSLEVKNKIVRLTQTLASQKELLAPSSEESKILAKIVDLMISENTLRVEAGKITKAADTKARKNIFSAANIKRSEISTLITQLNFTDKMNIYSIKAKEIAAQHPQAQLDLTVFVQAEKTVKSLIDEFAKENDPAKLPELFNKIKLQIMQSEISLIHLEMSANSKTIESLITTAQNKKTPVDEQLKLIDKARNLVQRIDNSYSRLAYLEQSLRAQPLKSEKSKAVLQTTMPWKHSALSKDLKEKATRSEILARHPTTKAVIQPAENSPERVKPGRKSKN